MSEKNDLDDAAAPESAEVFEFGESTILQLRNQPFRVGDQYSTMMSVPLPDHAEEGASPFAEPSDPAPSAESTAFVAKAAPINASAAAAGSDPVVRLEEKLDLALRQIASLQQRLDSIDSALSRVLNR